MVPLSCIVWYCCQRLQVGKGDLRGSLHSRHRFFWSKRGPKRTFADQDRLVDGFSLSRPQWLDKFATLPMGLREQREGTVARKNYG